MKRSAIIFIFNILLTAGAWGQAPGKYTASFVSVWGKDTVSIETFTIIGNHVYGKAIHLFPEVHMRHFDFWYNHDGSFRTFDVQFFEISNTSIPLESKTGHLPYRWMMNSNDNVVDFRIINGKGEDQIIHLSPQINFLGGWIPMMAQFEWNARLMKRRSVDVLKNLKFVNPYIGVEELELRSSNDNSIIFNSNITESIRIDSDENGHIKYIDAIGSVWNFKIYKNDPIDVESYTDYYATKPMIGDPSPHEKFSKKVGSTLVEIDYGRPSKRNRKIFGEIVPYNTVWRTGAGAPTTIEFDHDLSFQGEVIPKGKYNVYTIPRKNSWTLIFNTQENAWGSVYKPEFDFKHVEMQAYTRPDVVEKFQIEIDEKRSRGVLRFAWDKTRASIRFSEADEN